RGGAPPRCAATVSAGRSRRSGEGCGWSNPSASPVHPPSRPRNAWQSLLPAPSGIVVTREWYDLTLREDQGLFGKKKKKSVGTNAARKPRRHRASTNQCDAARPVFHGGKKCPGPQVSLDSSLCSHARA